jgi:Cupin domain
MARCAFSSSPAEAAGRATSTTTQDEWIYVIDGEFNFEVGDKRFRVGAGESVFIPRKVPHVWARVSGEPSNIINVYQPAGKMEEFFREVGKYKGKPKIHEALFDELCGLFHDHGRDLLGPPLTGKWKVDEGGRVIHTA